MPSATQLYSFPAQLGRRGTTAVVVVGLHLVIAVGLIVGMQIRPAVPSDPYYPPPLPQHDPDPPRPHDPIGADDTGYRPPTIETKMPPPFDVAPPDARPADAGPPFVVPSDPAPVQVSAVRVLRGVQPLYPAAARRLNEYGSVIVRVRVGADGHPELVEVATSSGYARLDDAAISAVKRWVFAPAQTAVGPIVSWVTFTVTFRLTE